MASSLIGVSIERITSNKDPYWQSSITIHSSRGLQNMP